MFSDNNNILVMENEIWKYVIDHENYYQVSNLGRVKSLRFNKEKILKQSINNNGYLTLCLSKNKKYKNLKVHKLVAIAFLNHVPCGYKEVVNHIDFDRTNNNVKNLEIVTARENSNQKHLKSSSKYTGVSRCGDKWRAVITYGNKQKHIGVFKTELEASNAYELELKNNK